VFCLRSSREAEGGYVAGFGAMMESEGTVRRLMKLMKRTALLFAVVIVTLVAVRVYYSQRGAALEP
jgi:hypothetical protein